MHRCSVTLLAPQLRRFAIGSVLALALGSTSACKSPGPSTQDDSGAPSSQPSATRPATPAIDAAGIDARPPLDAAPLRPAWLTALNDLADLMCSCTTPSCIHRFGMRADAAIQALPAEIPERLRDQLTAAQERLAKCRGTGTADGLGDSPDAGHDGGG